MYTSTEMKFQSYNGQKKGEVIENFVLIEGSKILYNDIIFSYTPRTNNESKLRELIIHEMKNGFKDFYCPVCDPSIDKKGEIFYSLGRKPAIGKSPYWWAINAKKFDVKHNSHLGTVSEYVTFLTILIKQLYTEKGWTIENSWNAVCNDQDLFASRYYLASGSFCDPSNLFPLACIRYKPECRRDNYFTGWIVLDK